MIMQKLSKRNNVNAVLLLTILMGFLVMMLTIPASSPENNEPIGEGYNAVQKNSGLMSWIQPCSVSSLGKYQKSYSYTNSEGSSQTQDSAVFAFWILPDTGEIYQNPQDVKKCIMNTIYDTHKHQGKVFATIGIDLGYWSLEQVITYVRKAVNNPDRYFSQIAKIAEQMGFDGVINDIEGGDTSNPSQYTQYNMLLHQELHKVGLSYAMTLIPTTFSIASFQNWQELSRNNAADWYIIMMLDEYPSRKDIKGINGFPSSVATPEWIESLYVQAVENLPAGRVAFELPMYCTVWQGIYTIQKELWYTPLESDIEEQPGLRTCSEMIAGNKLLKDKNGYYVRYISKKGYDTVIRISTVNSILSLVDKLQSLSGSQCIHLSFWVRSASENPLLWSELKKHALLC